LQLNVYHQGGTKFLRNIVTYLPKDPEVHVTRQIYINTAVRFLYPGHINIFVV